MAEEKHDSRKKEAFVVVPSQNIFIFLAKSALVITAIGLVVLLFIAGKESFKKKAEEAKGAALAGVSSSAPVASAVVAKPTKEERVTAPVGDWSSQVKIPPSHWFRIHTAGKSIRIQTVDGREFDNGPNEKSIGSEIRNPAFRYKSLEGVPVEIITYLEPK